MGISFGSIGRLCRHRVLPASSHLTSTHESHRVSHPTVRVHPRPLVAFHQGLGGHRSRISATRTSSSCPGCSGNGKLKRAKATSRVTFPWRSACKGTHSLTSRNDSKPLILVGSQHGDHRTSFACQCGQEFRRHTLPIHHDALNAVQPSRLLVARDHSWQSHRQMLIPSMRRHEERVAFLIVQDDERTATQNLFNASHQPTGNQVICVDGFAVPIDVKNRNRAGCQMWSRLPERSCPVCQSLGEGFICPRFRQLCQKPLGVAIAVSEAATRE